jgi:integrase/recombinase XerD
MRVSQGIEQFFNYQRLNVKKNTFRNYEFILANFQQHFGNIELSSISSKDVLAFMTEMSGEAKQSTKKLRFTLLAVFFNYIKNTVDSDFQNPCDNPALRKLFRAGKPTRFKILEKDVVDEIIFRTPNPRNRLLLELMARAGMRVGEVLRLRPKDIEDRKAIIRAPKSGKDAEAAFLRLIQNVSFHALPEAHMGAQAKGCPPTSSLAFDATRRTPIDASKHNLVVHCLEGGVRPH